MGIISREEIKTKLTECNILLKYMSFLQKNGFSDCGKGQVLGQVTLLQEYLESYVDNQRNCILVSQQREETEESNQVQKEPIVKQNYLNLSQQNAENDDVDDPNEIKSGFLKNVGNIIVDRSTSLPGNEDKFKTEKLEMQASQQLAHLGKDNRTNRVNATESNSKQTARSEIKEMTGSWFEKIKRITEIDEWR